MAYHAYNLQCGTYSISYNSMSRASREHTNTPTTAHTGSPANTSHHECRNINHIPYFVQTVDRFGVRRERRESSTEVVPVATVDALEGPKTHASERSVGTQETSEKKNEYTMGWTNMVT